MTVNYALFDRRVHVQVAKVAIDFNVSEPAAGEADGFKIRFHVEKNPRARQPNIVNLEIHNLAKATRDALDRATTLVLGPPLPGQSAEAVPVIIEAGYAGGHGVIFSGHGTEIVHSHEGPNMVTRIAAADGYLSNEVTIKTSHAKGLTQGQVITNFLDALKKARPDLKVADAYARAKAGDVNGAADTLKRAFVSSGLAITGLTKHLEGTGLEVSEQDGVIQLLALKEIADPTNIVVLGPDTGLVGKVLPVRDDKRPNDFIIKAQSLLRHEIFIGSGVRFVGTSSDGLFKIRELTHIGDTYGHEWNTSFEAVRVPEPASPEVTAEPIFPTNLGALGL